MEPVGGLGRSVCLDLGRSMFLGGKCCRHFWGGHAYAHAQVLRGTCGGLRGSMFLGGKCRVEPVGGLGWSCVCAAWNLWRLGVVCLFRFEGFYVSGWVELRGTCGGLGWSVCLDLGRSMFLGGKCCRHFWGGHAYALRGTCGGWGRSVCLCARASVAWNLWRFEAFCLPMRKCTCCVEFVGGWGRSVCLDLRGSMFLGG